MATAEIHLSDSESAALKTLAKLTGRTEAELLHEAVERLLNHPNGKDRLALLRKAKGIWKDRTDLPDLRELRAELERFS